MAFTERMIYYLCILDVLEKFIICLIQYVIISGSQKIYPTEITGFPQYFIGRWAYVYRIVI